MPQLLEDLVDRGYEIYGVTGRPAAQEADTVINLNNEGFPMFNAGNLYTKDVANQSWVDCNADGVAACSTVEYKAFTRQHIEDNGTPGDSSDDLDVVMNVGDQWSDLEGGYADDYTKIPNPTYFLASPDIPGAPASDANMVPPTSYLMQPDGSSGYSVASGDDIPNIDPVRKMIRGYYNASSSGIADKGTSNYINQLTSLESVWTPQVSDNCTAKDQARTAALQEQTAAQQAVTAAQAAVAKDTKAVDKAKKRLKKAKTKGARKAAHKKLRKAQQALTQSRAALAAAQAELAGITVPAAPAVVFDADDTTLWTYDMEDGAMKFVFDPVLQATWVSQHLFRAVPGMTGLVKAAKAAGCTVFGLTGRGTSQQADTIANLTEKGYVDAASKPLFTAAHYFTKGAVTVSNSNASIPSQPWVDCGSDNACSTIEYKSGTRAHIEDLGFDVVGNFGDQWSDLVGEHADHVYKLPNATYYLP
jgi:predicted secreted acid phosphatase